MKFPVSSAKRWHEFTSGQKLLAPSPTEMHFKKKYFKIFEEVLQYLKIEESL